MNDYDRILKPIKFSLNIIGWNILKKNWKLNIISVLSFFTIVNLAYGSLIFMSYTADIYIYAECGATLGSLLPILPKMLILYAKRNKIFNFVGNIRGQTQVQYSMEVEGQLNIEYTKRFINFTKILYLTFLGAVLTFFINPLFDLDSRRLPLFDHIPFLPVDRTPYYQLNYVYQLWTFVVGTNSMAGIDLFACYHIYYTCNRIEVLSKMVQLWNDEIKRESKILKGGRSGPASWKIYKCIVEQHALVKRTMVEIQDIFAPMILAVLISNSFVICMCLMILVADPFSKVIFHCMVVFSQTFMYCFIGNLLLVKNDQLTASISQVDSYSLSISEQKGYNLMVQNVYKPIEFKAVFVTLNLELFQEIVKVAYSLFNIMKNVQ